MQATDEAEALCVSKDSHIALSSGISIPIDFLKSYSTSIQSFDGKGIVSRQRVNYVDKGVKRTVKLTLEDGTQLTLTPDHKLMTENGEWVEAKDLLNIRVKTGTSGPNVNPENEIKCNPDWKLSAGAYTFSLRSPEEYFRSLAFARMIGLLITDGTISETNLQASVYLYNQSDIDQMLDDIELLTRKRPSVTKCETSMATTFKISFPMDLSRCIAELPGILIGEKSLQAAVLPAFVIDPNCPLGVVREFLGGLFGGDGVCPGLVHRSDGSFQLSSIRFGQTKCATHIGSLRTYMDKLIELLGRFGINDITVQEPRLNMAVDYSNDETKSLLEKEKRYVITMHLGMSELSLFGAKIGFRYCIHKGVRLAAACSYRKLVENTLRQQKDFISRLRQASKFGTDEELDVKPCYEEIMQTSLTGPIFNKFYCLPTYKMARERLSRDFENVQVPTMRRDKFPSVESYLESIGALHLFLNEGKPICYAVSSAQVPTFALRVIHISESGEKEVCDIEVQDTHNFLAESIVSHNCNYLVKNGLADATFSLDSDCVAYQVPVLINDVDISTGMCRVVYFKDLCEALELEPSEVTLFCILCGCDYNRHTKLLDKVGPVTALKMVKKQKTYAALQENEEKFKLPEDGLRHDRCVELFNLQYPEIKEVPWWDIRLDFEALGDFLREKHLFCDMSKIKRYWSPPKIVFAEEVASDASK
jgi:intein/homing endonuclease